MSPLTYFLAIFYVLAAYLVYAVVRHKIRHPLQSIAGPPPRSFLHNQLGPVLDPAISPAIHELYVKKYGRSIHIQGIGPLDQRLLTLDPVSVAHVLKNSTIYEKPWQSRRFITYLIGCGMLAAERLVHKRQRRVGTPAFSIQNLRSLIPLFFNKGNLLKEKWLQLGRESASRELTVDVCHWVSRATFDVIGVAGFDYEFNAIEGESNELFSAYKEMFEVTITMGNPARNILRIYFPFVDSIIPDKVHRTVIRCHAIIRRVAGHLIQEKKAKILQGEQEGVPYSGRDLLTLLLKSNLAGDLPQEQRISDEDILNNINTFLFAGSDTSSLSLTWTLLLLAENPIIQDRLRSELLSIQLLPQPSILTEDEIQSLYTSVADLPFLDNVVRESIRLIPPVHSSIRVATQDDEIPTSYPVFNRDRSESNRTSISIPKGTFVHVAVEGFNLDKLFWGEDAWKFQPDRWNDLPDTAASLPGLYSNTLTFSAGPRSCIGMRFSMIEIKTFLYILLTAFKFRTTEDKITKANVILTRPYIAGKIDQGSQLPLVITPIIHDDLREM